jgi:hypothetical protein
LTPGSGFAPDPGLEFRAVDNSACAVSVSFARALGCV